MANQMEEEQTARQLAAKTCADRILAIFRNGCQPSCFTGSGTPPGETELGTGNRGLTFPCSEDWENQFVLN